jgi:UPF0716 protein FxsA
MFVLFLVGAPIVEVFVFIEVGLAIGWLRATALLLGTSLLSVPLLRIQGRSAIERVSLAVSERRPPGPAAVDGALGLLGGMLLIVPGFVTAALGALLVFPPTRALARRWVSRRYARRVMAFVAAAGRFAPGDRRARPADVESTAVDDDQEQLGG